MTRAETLHNAIKNALASGKTVMIATYGRAVKITPKTAKGWEDQGLELFRIEGEHLCIAQGKTYNSIMGAKVTAH
jgi:hypothetical protein